MSGLDSDELLEVIEARADELEATPITVDLGEQVVVVDAETLGFAFDTEATHSDVLNARHGDTIWDEFGGWFHTRRWE